MKGSDRMSMLNPIVMLNGKRKEIFDIVFTGDMEKDFTKEQVAKILLDYEEDKLDELKEEITNLNINPVELIISKQKDFQKENSFEFLNKKIEKLTKELADAYRNNDQEQITKLQDKIKEATDKQLKKNVDKLVKKELKREKEYIKQNLDKEKIKEQQKVIDEINKRIVAYLVENWTMSTPEFKSLRQELRVAISRMECYKNAIYDEKEIERIYNDSNLLEEKILGKASYINREELLSKLGYLYNYKEKRKNYSTEEEFILGELVTIKEEMLFNDGVDVPYTPNARAKHCINEFIYYLERNQVKDCLMDIYEVIESDKNEIYSPINKDFKYSIYISNEEKSIILNMVNRLESHLNNTDNQYSTEKLFEKAKSEFNGIVENEYGINKYLSLPLPVSHNKLKSLILLSAVEENAEIYNCGYVLIDTITGNVEYKLAPEYLLSNAPELNVLNLIPKIEISINSKEEYDSLYNKYFKLLDDLILIYSSKEEYISSIDKVREFLNIYRNITSESEQNEYSFTNDFLIWCLVLSHEPEIKKLDFEKIDAIMREMYIDENGHEMEREKIIKIPVLPNDNASNFDKAKEQAEEIASKLGKIIIKVEENDEFWRFEADYAYPKTGESIDGGAGSSYVSKSDNSIRKYDLIERDFNQNFEQTSKVIYDYYNDIAFAIDYVVNEILKLENDSEFYIGKLIPENINLSIEEKFILCDKVLKKCKLENISFVEKYSDSDIGLPFNIPYIRVKYIDTKILEKEVMDMQKSVIEFLEEQGSKLIIDDEDPFVRESCRDVYKALMVVNSFEEHPENDVLVLLDDLYKTIKLLRKFNFINEEEFDGNLPYTIGKDDKILVFLVELLKTSIIKNGIKE